MGMQRGDVASPEEEDDRLTWVNSVGVASPLGLVPVGGISY